MKRWALLAIATAAFACAAHQASAQIVVSDAWARASAGVGTTGAVYLTLTNTGADGDRLIGITSALAAAAELHTTLQEGDIMRMRHLDSIDLAPGASAELTPIGMHIMLIDLKAPLKQGERFPLTLSFEKAGPVTAEVAVRGPGAASHRH